MGDEDRNGWRTWSRCPAIAELQKQVPGGRCVFCERVLKPSRTREKYVCVGADCQTAYNSEYVRWQRMQQVKKGLTQRGKRRRSTAERWARYYGEEETRDG